MNILNSIIGKIFEILFFPFQNMNPWAGLVFISFVTGIFMLIIFRFTSNQKGIKAVKNKIKAHLLELRLYKDNLRLTFLAQGNILRANLKYIGYSTKPMLVMIIPLVLIIIQLNFWFAYDSLLPGQKAILKVKFNNTLNPIEMDIDIKASPGIALDSPPLRIEEENEINWRLSILEKGLHEIHVLVDSRNFSKNISVEQKALKRISPRKVRSNVLQQLIYPGEPPLPKESPIQYIEVLYSGKNMSFFGLSLHWLIIYFAISILFGFTLKRFFKVEI